MLGNGVEQRDRLQPVAARTRAEVFHHAPFIDALLHRCHLEAHAPAGNEFVAVLVHLGKVVAGIDMQYREGQACRGEGQYGEVQQHSAVFAAAEQQHRVLALGSHLADDGDGFVGERVEMVVGEHGHIGACARRAG